MWFFTHDIITQNTSIAILCIFIDEESNKKWHGKEGKFFHVIFCNTQSFFLGFSWSSNNITASNQKNTSRKASTSLSEITISCFHRNIIIPLLCQCELYIHTCVSKTSTVPKDIVFYLLWYNEIRWNSHICKKSFFLSFYSLLFLVITQGKW